MANLSVILITDGTRGVYVRVCVCVGGGGGLHTIQKHTRSWKPGFHSSQFVVAQRRYDNFVLSTELMMSIGHRKALALRRSESRNCGLCGLYTERWSYAIG